MKSVIVVLLLGLFLLTQCETKEEKTESVQSNVSKSKVTNPNGMSEMSLKMEDWYSNMEALAEQLRNNKTVTSATLDTVKIKTAQTSKPNVHGSQFNAFVESFFVSYDMIAKGATRDAQINQFNQTVTACINCHQQFCHGPIVRIKNLFVR